MTPSGHVVDYLLSVTTFPPNSDGKGIILDGAPLINDFHAKKLLAIQNCNRSVPKYIFQQLGRLLHIHDNWKTTNIARNGSGKIHVYKTKICTQLCLGVSQMYLFLHVFERD